MEYNTSLKKLVLPEYGRHLQRMVNFTKTIEDRDKRNQAAQSIIQIMGNMNPHLRDINDFKHKLWDHLAIMADFDLDIDSPYPIPARETFEEKPATVPYSQGRMKYRHFGKIIEEMIRVAANMDDEEKKQILINIIINHMKKSFLMWNKDTVTDETILAAFRDISDGKIEVSLDDLQISNSRDLLHKNNNNHTARSPKKRRTRRK